MVISPQKQVSLMPSLAAHVEQLDQIHELNRLFLHFLRDRAQVGADCLGLARPTAAMLCYADDAALDSAAEFPRALFDLMLAGATATSGVRDPGTSAAERSRQALNLTILLCAWNVSRQSGYRARLFLGLGRPVIHRLRTTPLSELPRLAPAPNLVAAAFPRAERLWRGLLQDERPEMRQRLALIALQPGVEQDWPAADIGRAATS
jgi:hypothetical protein